MRTRWFLAATLVPACAAALLFTAPASAETAPLCRATRLPTLGNDYTRLVGGDPSGRYLVGTSGSRNLVWERGKPRLLDTSPIRPYLQTDPTGVNEHGVIIGSRMDDTFATDAWMYRDGRFTMLPGLRPADDTMPKAINARGDVTGTSLAVGTAPGPWHAVVWPADQPGTVRELPVPAGATQTFAYDIDDDGTVLGYAGPYPGGTAYVWPPDGAPYPLPVPSGFLADNVEGLQISNGWVAGAGQKGNRLFGLRWNLRDQTVQVGPTAYTAYFSVNRSGGIGANGAILHRDGRTIRLRSDGVPLVLTDNGAAAGNITRLGIPVIWTGC